VGRARKRMGIDKEKKWNVKEFYKKERKKDGKGIRVVKEQGNEKGRKKGKRREEKGSERENKTERKRKR
jgi:hypothetical protein